MTAKPEFNYVTFIDAPREKVWQALTDPEFTKRYWFNSTVESDWKEGSEYTFRVPDDKDGERVVLTGKIIKVDKPKELVYQFTAPWNEAVRDEDSTVQFLLEEIEGMTKLSVRRYRRHSRSSARRRRPAAPRLSPGAGPAGLPRPAGKTAPRPAPAAGRWSSRV